MSKQFESDSSDKSPSQKARQRQFFKPTYDPQVGDSSYDGLEMQQAPSQFSGKRDGGRFTPRAELLWSDIPEMGRKRILANVFCFHCQGSVHIVDFAGEERRGVLYLHGSCGKCGREVVRAIEKSESDHSQN